jgi:hypothetical protein
MHEPKGLLFPAAPCGIIFIMPERNLPAENPMRAPLVSALLVSAVLATAACSNDMQDQQPASVAPPVGSNLGPTPSVGQGYSTGSGSISNGASGSSVLQQEGGGIGFRP